MYQAVDLIIKEQAIVVEVADLLRELRRSKNFKQQDVLAHVDIKRQVLSKLENGHKQRVDLVQVAKIVNAYGEELIVTTSSQNKKSLINTEAEDQVLRDFAEGKIGEATEGIEALRHWQYPLHRIEAKCKRDLAIAISYHFKGNVNKSYNLMNDIVMALAILNLKKEVEHFIDIYQRVIREGEAKLAE